MTNERRIEKAAGKTVRTLLTTNFREAIGYITPKLRVKASVRRYKHQRDHRSFGYDIVLTVGRPNSREKHFVAAAIAAGEPFPIRKVQVR
jgi:hypothetical protein